MELILAIIIVIGSIGAVAQGAESQDAKGVERCTKLVKAAVSSEDAPGAIESCYDAETRGYIFKCTNKQCVFEVSTGQ
jgi:hypothetical protein